MTLKRQDVIDRILAEQEATTGIRREERQINKTIGSFGAGVDEPTSDAQKIHALLESFIPSHLLPTNVGELEKVLWPKWYQVNFTSQDSALFGTNPTITAQSVYKKSFRTVQDAGYLLLGFTRNFATHGNAGKGAPWEVVFRDNQSSRQIMDFPVMIQSIGFNSIMTKLPTPYYFLPNSSFGVELSSFVENDVNLAGDGSQYFTFFGLEVRSGELNNILTTVYSSEKA